MMLTASDVRWMDEQRRNASPRPLCRGEGELRRATDGVPAAPAPLGHPGALSAQAQRAQVADRSCPPA